MSEDFDQLEYRLNNPCGIGAPSDHDAMEEAARTIKQYKLLCGRLYDTLMQYADPGFYHAISILADPPCGGFAEDEDENFEGFTDTPYDYPKPGKLARERIRKMQEIFGDLVITTEIDALEAP